MRRKDKKALYSCNRKDLLRLIHNQKNVENYFSQIMEYIARHEMYGGNTKADLNELLYAAKNELIYLEGLKHKNSDTKVSYDKIDGVSKNDSDRIKNFIRNPVDSFRNELRTIAGKPADENEMDDDKLTFDHRLKVNSTMLFQQVKVTEQSGKYAYGDYSERMHIENNLMRRLPEKENIDDALKRINSGVFGRLFRRPSKEYKAFENSLKDFRDAGMAHSGNTADLEDKTTKYLKHLIPEFDYKKMGEKKMDWLSNLPKDQRNRAEFAMNVLDSVDEQRKMKPFMDNVENAVNGKKFDASIDKANQVQEEKVNENNEIKNEINNDKQKDFQNNILEDVKKEEKEEVIDINKDKEEVSKEKEAENLEANNNEIAA